MPTAATEMPQALCKVDATGLVTVQALPSWWRQQVEDGCLPQLAEEFARIGDEARSDDVCGVLGRTTRRPCRHNTRVYGPCPNHCETPQSFHCATERKKGGWCRWDLRKGICDRHPYLYDQYTAAIRAAEEEELRRQAARAEERRKAAEERRIETLKVACPLCDAQPGEICVRSNGEEHPNLHGAREKRWRHIEAANEMACSSCGAAVGELCRTSSGKIADGPHSGR